MGWKIQISKSAKKEVHKLNKMQALNILDIFDKKVASLDNPTTFAKPLCYEYSGLHRLRVGNYRVVFYVIEEKKTLQITRVRHRKDAYKD